MKIAIYRLINRILRRMGFALVSEETFVGLRSRSPEIAGQVLGILEEFPSATQIIHLIPESSSQLGQDLLAVAALDGKRDGFFVEFGAGDGELLSNTNLLEKRFGWKGILAEPDPASFAKATLARNCVVDPRAVTGSTGEVRLFQPNGLYGSLVPPEPIEEVNNHEDPLITVESVSLEGLLAAWNAPHQIDFLSIDIEGGELDVLRDFDFNAYKFGLITVEHNYDEVKRVKIQSILERAGYRRVCAAVSLWDDWWVSK